MQNVSKFFLYGVFDYRNHVCRSSIPSSFEHGPSWTSLLNIRLRSAYSKIDYYILIICYRLRKCWLKFLEQMVGSVNHGIQKPVKMWFSDSLEWPHVMTGMSYIGPGYVICTLTEGAGSGRSGRTEDNCNCRKRCILHIGWIHGLWQHLFIHYIVARTYEASVFHLQSVIGSYWSHRISFKSGTYIICKTLQQSAYIEICQGLTDLPEEFELLSHYWCLRKMDQLVLPLLRRNIHNLTIRTTCLPSDLGVVN